MLPDRQPLSRTTSPPAQSPLEPLIQSRPEEQLKYIRDVMARTSTFTAVPGLGAIWMGITAVAAAFIASMATSRDLWLVTWMCEAGLGAAIGLVAMHWKAKAAKTPLKSGAGRKFFTSFAPPLFAGIVLTIALWHGGKAALLPGTWMLMYGISTVAGGAFSVRIVPITGVLFIGAGALTLFLPPAWGDFMMGLTFGGLHLVFGTLIAKYHGG